MEKMLFRQARRILSFGLSFVALVSAGMLPAGADPFEVPAIVSPATTQHLVGKVIWLDLESTQPARAKKFYAGLFGWDFRDYHADGADYAVAMQDGRPLAGILHRRIRRDEERSSGWLPFISVPVVDAAVSTALQHHAHIQSEPGDLPLRGRQARLIDPEGVRFAILASSSGDPPDIMAVPGTWVRTELVARDSADEGVFYQQVFGYEVTGAPTNAGFERIRLSSGGHVRIAVNELPTDAPALHPHWVNFVGVIDVANVVARARRLGGHVIVNVHRDSQGRQSAVLADPTGASFGVAELPGPGIATTLP